MNSKIESRFQSDDSRCEMSHKPMGEFLIGLIQATSSEQPQILIKVTPYTHYQYCLSKNVVWFIMSNYK